DGDFAIPKTSILTTLIITSIPVSDSALSKPTSESKSHVLFDGDHISDIFFDGGCIKENTLCLELKKIIEPEEFPSTLGAALKAEQVSLDHQAGLDQLENPLPLEREVKGSILTPYKARGPLEAASLPSGRGKAVYISPPPLPSGRRDWIPLQAICLAVAMHQHLAVGNYYSALVAELAVEDPVAAVVAAVAVVVAAVVAVDAEHVESYLVASFDNIHVEKQMMVESSAIAVLAFETGQTWLDPMVLKQDLGVLDAEVVAGEVEGVGEVAMAATEDDEGGGLGGSGGAALTDPAEERCGFLPYSD
ncbi:hypothetical protein Tco_1140210, partial [Tanacetum coccineum]